MELHLRSSAIFTHATYDHCSVLLRRGYGFMDDVIFAHNGHYGGYRLSMPLQRVTSLRRRARSHTPAASYWLRRVVDDARRRY